MGRSIDEDELVEEIKSLKIVLEKARKVGMSYGKYVAMMDGTPKIWQGEK